MMLLDSVQSRCAEPQSHSRVGVRSRFDRSRTVSVHVDHDAGELMSRSCCGRNLAMVAFKFRNWISLKTCDITLVTCLKGN